MSDTSIYASGSSEYDYYSRQDNCWTRIGANICVFLCTLSTLLLLIALIFIFHREYGMEERRRIKAERTGKRYNPKNMFGIFKNVVGYTLDDDDTSSHHGYDDQSYNHEHDDQDFMYYK